MGKKHQNIPLWLLFDNRETTTNIFFCAKVVSYLIFSQLFLRTPVLKSEYFRAKRNLSGKVLSKIFDISGETFCLYFSFKCSQISQIFCIVSSVNYITFVTSIFNFLSIIVIFALELCSKFDRWQSENSKNLCTIFNRKTLLNFEAYIMYGTCRVNIKFLLKKSYTPSSILPSDLSHLKSCWIIKFN